MTARTQLSQKLISSIKFWKLVAHQVFDILPTRHSTAFAGHVIDHSRIPSGSVAATHWKPAPREWPLQRGQSDTDGNRSSLPGITRPNALSGVQGISGMMCPDPAMAGSFRASGRQRLSHFDLRRTAPTQAVNPLRSHRPKKRRYAGQTQVWSITVIIRGRFSTGVFAASRCFGEIANFPPAISFVPIFVFALLLDGPGIGQTGYGL